MVPFYYMEYLQYLYSILKGKVKWDSPYRQSGGNGMKRGWNLSEETG